MSKQSIEKEGDKKQVRPRKLKKPSRPRDPQATKVRILEAALTEFCTYGFKGARIDNIARRADVNKRLIYAYVGPKKELYLKILEDSYRHIRQGERELDLESQEADVSMETLIRFTFQHFQKNPSFIKLLLAENQNEAQFLKHLHSIQDMHSPLVGQIGRLLKQGEGAGLFRADVDPVQLYISIAALGFFYLSNRYTLSTVFDIDLCSDTNLSRREEHIVELIMTFLRKPD